MQAKTPTMFWCIVAGLFLFTGTAVKFGLAETMMLAGYIFLFSVITLLILRL